MSEISVVVTVRNDREGLAELLPALEAQTRQPDELVVVDAGSTDGTDELLGSWHGSFPLRTLVAEGANISAGRNVGIRAAANEWIACTDAGCRPVRGWLAAFDAARDGHEFLGGVYSVSAASPFERSVALALYPSVEEIDSGGPLVRLSQRLFGRRFEAGGATGRSMAFTRRTWEAVGGFPEELYAGEDVAFSRAAVERFQAALVPGAVVSWSPRPDWRSTARMYFVYGRGDGRSGGIRRHLARGAVAGGAVLLAARGGAPGKAAVAAGAASYLSVPFARAARSDLSVHEWLWRIPLMVAMKDAALFAGAIAGRVDRAVGRSQPVPR